MGDSVVVIGNPPGELTFSLTSGSISTKDREVAVSIGEQIQSIEEKKQDSSNYGYPGNFPWGRG